MHFEDMYLPSLNRAVNSNSDTNVHFNILQKVLKHQICLTFEMFLHSYFGRLIFVNLIFVEPTKNRTLFMDVPFPNCFLKNEVWRTFKVDFSLRDHPFKMSANFTQFLTPPHTECFQMEVKVAV